MSNETPSSAPKVETNDVKNLDSFVVSVDFFGKLKEKQAVKTAEFKAGLNDLSLDDLKKLKAQIVVEQAKLEKPIPTGEPEPTAIEAIMNPQPEPKKDRFRENRKAAFAEFEAAVDTKIAEKKAGEVVKVETKTEAALEDLRQKQVIEAALDKDKKAAVAPKSAPKKAEGVWSKDAQNKKAAEIKALGEEIYTVKKGDTLGAIVKGLTGKLNYLMPVDYQSDKLKKEKRPAKLAEANLIYPGQFVWVKDGKVIVADKQEEVAVAEETELPPRGASATEQEGSSGEDAEPAPKFTVAPTPPAASPELSGGSSVRGKALPRPTPAAAEAQPAAPKAEAQVSAKKVPVEKSAEAQPVWVGAKPNEEGLTKPNPASDQASGAQSPAWTKKE